MSHIIDDRPEIWFPALRRRPATRLQLFCFPFAGGGASAFIRWPDCLPSWIEIWPVEYPAHETRSREPAVTNAKKLAAAIARQIAAVAVGPFALFGHSMGALLAYETTRALKRDFDLAPQALFVSGFSAPHLPPFRPPLRNLPEPEFRDELRRYGGTPEELLADEDFMQFISPLLRSDFGLCETYAHLDDGKLDIPLIAFGGWDDFTVPCHRLLDWSEVSSGSFTAHFMSGGHFFIKEQALRVTRLIARYLEGTGNGDLSAPERDEVHLWVIRISTGDARLASFKSTLSLDEQQRCEAFLQSADQARFVCARAALRDLLQRYTRLPAGAIVFSYSNEEKPGCPAALPIEFNVSHSGAVAAIGVTSDQSIGVDVEQIKHNIYTPDLIEQIVSSYERRQLAAVNPDQRVQAFFDFWVRKESHLKRTGEGFTGTPQWVEAGLSKRFHTGTAAYGRSVDDRIQSFTIADGYAAAVATERPAALTTVRYWHAE